MRRHLDLLVALGCFAAAVIELILADADRLGLQIGLSALATLPVALRPRTLLLPLACLVAAYVGLGVADLEPLTGAVVPLLFLMYSAGERWARRGALAALALTAGAFVLDSALTGEFEDLPFVVALLMALPLAMGMVARGRRLRMAELAALRAELEAEQERAAELAAMAERRRIAREMHDVLSHGLGVMTLQAGAGRTLAQRDPAGAAESFAAIRRAGQQALAELEDALAAAEPVRGVGDLAALVEGVRAGGLDSELQLEGDHRALPAGVGVAVHRIVQEALTNTVKHARASRVSVRVAQRGDAVEVLVVDDGTGEGPGGGTSAGLVAMRERAALYGGTVEAGPRPDRGFEVRARIPLTVAT